MSGAPNTATGPAKTGRLTYALAQLSGRERVLVLVLGLVAVPLALAFLVAMPLLEARDTARAQAAEAQNLLDWVSDQVRKLPADDVEIVTQIGGGAEPLGISGIEESLVRAGLRENVSNLSNRNGGGVDLALEGAEFAVLAEWLQDIVPRWGYRIAAFRIDTLSPGFVNASFELETGLGATQ